MTIHARPDVSPMMMKKVTMVMLKTHAAALHGRNATVCCLRFRNVGLQCMSTGISLTSHLAGSADKPPRSWRGERGCWAASNA